LDLRRIDRLPRYVFDAGACDLGRKRRHGAPAQGAARTRTPARVRSCSAAWGSCMTRRACSPSSSPPAAPGL